jgi:hypothetical protein
MIVGMEDAGEDNVATAHARHRWTVTCHPGDHDRQCGDVAPLVGAAGDQASDGKREVADLRANHGPMPMAMRSLEDDRERLPRSLMRK